MRHTTAILYDIYIAIEQPLLIANIVPRQKAGIVCLLC